MKNKEIKLRQREMVVAAVIADKDGNGQNVELNFVYETLELANRALQVGVGLGDQAKVSANDLVGSTQILKQFLDNPKQSRQPLSRLFHLMDNSVSEEDYFYELGDNKQLVEDLKEVGKLWKAL